MDHSRQDAETEEEKLEQIRAEISSGIAKTMDIYGVTPSVGQLYATLYFSEEPMTLDQLREELGMSKTSMSTGVRKLESNKMVRKIWKKGVRKHLYQGETDFFQNFVNFFVPLWKREIEVNMDAIKKCEPELRKLCHSENPVVREKAAQDMEKIQYAKKYYEWLKKLTESFETGEIYECIPKDGNDIDRETEENPPNEE